MHVHLLDQSLELIKLGKAFGLRTVMSVPPLLKSLNENDGVWRMRVLNLFHRLEVEVVCKLEQLGPWVRQAEVLENYLGFLCLNDGVLRLVEADVAEHAVLANNDQGDILLLAELAKSDSSGVVHITGNNHLRVLDHTFVSVDEVVYVFVHKGTLAFQVRIHLHHQVCDDLRLGSSNVVDCDEEVVAQVPLVHLLVVNDQKAANARQDNVLESFSSS